MQLSIFTTAVFAGLAAAQFAGLPTCAVSLHPIVTRGIVA